MTLTENVVERYKGLLTAIQPELRDAANPDVLRDVIDQAGGDPTLALSEHVAARSPLTTNQVRPVVAAALAAAPAGDSQAQATAASQAVASAFPGVNVELSEAVMLNGTIRLAFSIGFGLILIGCVIAVVGVGTESNASEATLISLSVIAIIVLVAVLVLVMGYKTAKIKIGS